MKPEAAYFWTYQRPNAGAEKSLSWHSMFGLKLSSLRSIQIDDKLREESVRENLRKQVNFINSLYHEGAVRAFEIRHLSMPQPELPSSGTIQTVLFAKSSGRTEDEASANAKRLFVELSPLIHGVFEDYMFMPLEEKGEFDKYRTPFPAKFAAELRRRVDIVHLDTLKGRPSLQKIRKSPVNALSEDAACFVYPFVPTQSTLATIFRIMLLQNQPVVITASIAPATLSQKEEEALNREIAKCESLEKGQSSLSPVFGRRTAALAHAMEGQLAKLQDAPFLLRVQIISPAPLPRTFLEAYGVEITSFHHETPFREDIITAGYDIEIPASRGDQLMFIENSHFLEFNQSSRSEFPKDLRRTIRLVDAEEANCAFRLPIAINNDIPGLDTRRVRFVPVPKELSSSPSPKSLFLGINTYMGIKHPVFVPEGDRFYHMYCVGQTGTGKTTLLKTMILHDMTQKEGLIVLDPHGDLYKELIGLVPKDRWDDVVLLNPTDVDYPIGLNLLEASSEEEKYFIVREMKSIVERLLLDQYPGYGAGMMGPIFFKHMQMNMLLAMSNPDDPGTLVEFAETFQRDAYWKKWLPLRSADPHLRAWVTHSLKSANYTKITSDNGISIGDYISSKFTDYFLDPKLRLIFGQKHSTINIAEIMDQGKILLVNLAKGELTEANSRFFGMVLMAKIMAAAMRRIRNPQAERRACYLYVDEFQNIATSSFSVLLSEARKFGVGLVLANQFLSQITDSQIINAIFGNVGNLVAFRVGNDDATKLEPQFFPIFDRYHLTNIPNWEACAKMTVQGQVAHPFSLKTIVPPIDYKESTADEVVKRSRFSYGTARDKVEAEIEKSLMLEPKPE